MEDKNYIIKKIFNKETINYIIFGVATTLVNIFSYQIFLMLNIDYKVANIVALILAKAFAYITNKFLVFKSKREGLGELLKEFIRFVYTRGFTGLIDYFGLIFAVEFLNANKIISKYIIQVYNLRL